jgi:esterase/lipase superfamily enzyme
MKMRQYLMTVAAILIVTSALAQETLVETVTVPAKTTQKSRLIEAAPQSEIEARFAGESSSAIVRVFAYDKDHKLVGTEDPEEEEAFFTFRPQKAGEYYLLFQNPTSEDAKVKITLARSRGAPTRFEPAAIVRVFYACDRQILTNSPLPTFAAEFTNTLTYGVCNIAVPRAHELGELEGPSVFKLDFLRPAVEKVELVSGEKRTETQLYQAIEARNRISTNKSVLVFVHGFNVDFREGIRRVAQISYDLAHDGPVVFFSWPSEGQMSPAGYERDQRNSDLSVKVFKGFLKRLQQEAPDCTINIIAHSMGNKILARALQELTLEDPHHPKFGEIVMFAPDMDTGLFVQCLENAAPTARRLTLYASSRDLALKTSEGAARYPRAGEGGDDLVVTPWLESIDASVVDTSALGFYHSYYADNGTVLSDLFYLLQGKSPDERFGFDREKKNGMVYWRFKKRAR